jgi:hypothetical protein
MTQTEFDSILASLMDEDKASALLSVPGVYECVSEHFNNTVLEIWKSKRDEDGMDEEELRRSRQPDIPARRVLVEKGKLVEVVDDE